MRELWAQSSPCLAGRGIDTPLARETAANEDKDDIDIDTDIDIEAADDQVIPDLRAVSIRDGILSPSRSTGSGTGRTELDPGGRSPLRHWSHPQTTPPEAVERIWELSPAHPAQGCTLLAAMLALKDVRVLRTTIQTIHDILGLGTGRIDGSAPVGAHGTTPLRDVRVAARLAFQIALHVAKGDGQVPILARRIVA